MGQRTLAKIKGAAGENFEKWHPKCQKKFACGGLERGSIFFSACGGLFSNVFFFMRIIILFIFYVFIFSFFVFVRGNSRNNLKISGCNNLAREITVFFQILSIVGLPINFGDIAPNGQLPGILSIEETDCFPHLKG